MKRYLRSLKHNEWQYGDFIVRVPKRDRATGLEKYEVIHVLDEQLYGSYLTLVEAVNEIDKLYLKGELNNVNYWLETKPFIHMANAVICTYQERQEVSNERAPANSPAEIEWACTQLFNIASSAAYVGSEESQYIHAAAEFWKLTGCKPDLFTL